MGQYVTIEEMADLFPQIEGNLDKEQALATYILAAESIVDQFMGFSYGAYGAPSVRRLIFPPGPYATLPPHQAGSVSLVTDWNGDDLVGFWEVDSNGRLVALPTTSPLGTAIWLEGPYNVTAVWGVGPAPESVKQVVRELAINMERVGMKGGYTELVGVEGGGAIRHVSGLTQAHIGILSRAKDEALGRPPVIV